jgi:hypothetical protein
LELSTAVEVPIEHLESGIAPFYGDEMREPMPLLRIHSGVQKPECPFVGVCYEGHWFWIDKTDYLSKRTLGYVLLLLALADTGPKDDLPLLTIQAN